MATLQCFSTIKKLSCSVLLHVKLRETNCPVQTPKIIFCGPPRKQ